MSTLQIQFRRDTAANWTTNNPTLSLGEVGLETDTHSYKIGDGATAWASLTYNQLAPEITTMLFDGQSSDASAPSSGDLTVYSKAIAGRMMLKQVGPSGLTTALQPFLGRNKVGYWNPAGNATAAPGVFGYTAVTAIGTATSRTIATTNLFTRMRRIGYPSAASLASFAGVRIAVGQITVGSGTAGIGGFYKVCRFGCTDTVSVARQFVGVSSSTSGPSNAEPSSLTNVIGVGHGAADTNLKIFFGGSAAQTPISLGSNFPVNTANTDAYELALYAPSGSNNTVYYEVTRLNTGNVATGTLTGTAGTALPSSTTLLVMQYAWRCNNTSSTLVGLDIMSDYIEVENG